ncbi:MAG: hypothetical protein RMN51_12250 [Verrucomicrobiota bacterium]|nr:hypothetical protein [Verrucomicrobiota bacterium]
MKPANRLVVWGELGTLVVVSGWVLLSAFVVSGQGVRRGPPIEFSDPQTEFWSTNVSRLSRGGRLGSDLEEQLQRRPSPLQSLGDPLRTSPVLRPPPGPMIQSARVRELLDRTRTTRLDMGGDQGELSGLEGERRLRENFLQPAERSAERGRGSRLDLWSEFADALQNDPELAERLSREAGGGGARGGHEAGSRETERDWQGPDEIARGWRSAGESLGVLNRFPGLADSVWQDPAEMADAALDRRQREFREQRLEQFRAGLEAVAATPLGQLEGGLRPASGTGVSRPSHDAPATIQTPLWVKPAKDVLGTGGGRGALVGSGSVSASGLAGSSRPASALLNNPIPSAPASGGLESGAPPSPVPTRPIRGPSMPSPFTEIPRRPGL